MNAGEIADALKNNPQTEKYFKGVFPADKIPEHETKDQTETKAFVFNLDKSTEPGSHWVCIILNPPNQQANIYFDSYGMAPFQHSFEKFMDNCYIYNNYQLQYNLSTACGQWCLYIIYHILVKGDPLELVSFIFNNEDKLKNDYMCNNIVKRFYKIDTEVICKDFLLESLGGVVSSSSTSSHPSTKTGGFNLNTHFCQTCQPLFYVCLQQQEQKKSC